MKVTQHSDDMLVLDNTPWALCIAMAAIIVISAYCVAVLPFNGQPLGLIALPFFVVATTLFKGMARRDQAYFDRQAGTLTLRYRTLTSYHGETLPLSSVTGAEVVTTQSKTRHDGRKSPDTYCPAVRVDGDLRRLTNLSTNSGRHQRNVDLINSWLGGAENAGLP